MSKWIDEIAAEFVWKLFKKSKAKTDYDKAKEVHDYIIELGPKNLSEAMKISEKDWDIHIAWREAEQYAYHLMWKYYELF